MGRYASTDLPEDAVTLRRAGKHELPREPGRHKADLAPADELVNADNPANTGPLHRKGAHRAQRKTHGVSLGLAATGAMALVSGAAAQSSVNIGQPVMEAQATEHEDPITAGIVKLEQPRVLVTTEAAPPPPEPEPVLQVAPPKVEYTPPPPPPPAPVIVPPQPVQPPVSQGVAQRQAIVNAAFAQIGVNQDCTMLVTNSLRAIGINFHDWPIGYFTLGYQVSRLDALPGDLVYYANGGGGLAHIAVYAGNGRAVHGGYNGYQTVEFSVDVGSGPVFIRVT